VKFTEQGGEIELACTRLAEDGQTVTLQFEVRDTGIGMSEEQLQRLFTPFSQADGSTTRKYGGTGLGLSISHRLVCLMGGQISAASALGAGSTFRFTLSFTRVPAPACTDILPAELQGARILIVDDSAPALAILSESFAHLPVEVEACESAQAALARLLACDREQPFDLLLTDWRMPGMDGIALIQAVRDSPTLQHVPKLVLVTAFGRDDVQAQAEDMGVDGFLFKPVGPSALTDMLVNLFGQRSAATYTPRAPALRNHAGKYVLLAEDNAINQQIAVELLQMLGLSVDVADNGKLAVERLLAAPDRYGLILMDLQMPVMDGHAAALAIRQVAALDAIPIIALTAHAMADVRARCSQEGMQDYLTKPVQPEQLFEVVSRWLGDSPPPPAQALATAGIRLAEIDTSLGLRYMGGNHKLYRSLLERFATEQRSTLAQLQAWLSAGQLSKAEMRVHTLKGLAGSMGALHLPDIAGRLEAALQKGGETLAQAEWQSLLQELDSALRPLFADIAHYLALDTPVASAEAMPISASAREVLARLRTLLSEDDGEAPAYFEEHRPVFAQFLDAATVDKLAGQLHDYLFQDALETLGSRPQEA